MIRAYLVGTPSPYEGEDITVEFFIYKDDNLIMHKNIYMDYVKPAQVNHSGLERMLVEFRPYKEEEILVYINDTPLFEALNNTLQTKKLKDLILLGKKTQRSLSKFQNIQVINVATNPALQKEWLSVVVTN